MYIRYTTLVFGCVINYIYFPNIKCNKYKRHKYNNFLDKPILMGFQGILKWDKYYAREKWQLQAISSGYCFSFLIPP